ncbi:MAG: DUF6311 domain-containing protein [Bacteroidota bacterium]
MLSRISKEYSIRPSAINLLIVIIPLLILYQNRYGLGMLFPTNDGWLMKHDWATHYLGWFFYRNEPWGFPIGGVSNYLYPVGTNVGFTDSIPLASIFFKILSPLLPDKFQFVGLWLFMCHVMLAYFLIRLFDLFSVKGLVQLIGTLIIVFNPVLLHRSIHPALCSHWLIVGGLWVYFLDKEKYTPTRLLTYQGIFFVIGGLINPYFSIIGAGFFAATAWRIWQFDKTLSFGKTVLAGIIAFTSLFISWYVVGFFGFNNPKDLGVSGGYGLYPYNLNSLYNSGGWSAFFPGIPLVSWHQYESFMYLGAGLLVLVPVVLILTVIRFFITKSTTGMEGGFIKRNASLIPLLLFTVVVSLFAITNVITFNDKVLFTIHLPNKIQKIADVFRASARYVWVFYYLLLVITVVLTARLIKKTVVVLILLTMVFAIQLYDYKSLLGTEYVANYQPYHPPLDEARWRPLFEKMDKFIFYPPFESEYLSPGDYSYFCYLAADYKKPINLGYAARLDNKAVKDYTGELRRNIDHAVFDKRTLYISTPEFASRFIEAYQSGVVAGGRIDGYIVFFSKGLENDLAFSSVGNGLPESLKIKKTFGPFELTSNDKQAEWPVQVLRLERSVNNVFFKVLINGDTLIGKDGMSLLLKSEDDKFFASPVSRSVQGSTSQLCIAGTYFTNDLKPGNYKVALYSSAGKNSNVGLYRFIGNVNVGSEDFFQPRLISEVANVLARVEIVDDRKNEIEVRGWAFIQGQSSYGNRIEIILKSDDKIYRSPSDIVLRPDVTSYFKSPNNLDMSGFVSNVYERRFEQRRIRDWHQSYKRCP